MNVYFDNSIFSLFSHVFRATSESIKTDFFVQNPVNLHSSEAVEVNIPKFLHWSQFPKNHTLQNKSNKS